MIFFLAVFNSFTGDCASALTTELQLCLLQKSLGLTVSLKYSKQLFKIYSTLYSLQNELSRSKNTVRERHRNCSDDLPSNNDSDGSQLTSQETGPVRGRRTRTFT